MLFSQLCHFTPKQWEASAAADAHRYTLFGGSRGPGKSYFLRWYLLRFLLRCAGQGLRGVRVMLACEDYPALYERQVTKILTEFPSWLGMYRAGRNEYVLHRRYGGGVIALRNLDNPGKYKSSEFAAVGVDELTANPRRTFDTLRGSLRWPGVEQTRFVAASNPDGPHAMWVRQLWVERAFPDELADEASAFAFVPGLPTDNPYLPASYLRELDSLPELLRRAWRDGDWFVSVEGLVYAEFGAGNLTDEEPDPDLPIELAFDDGYIDPRAVLFIQRHPTHILVFDEIYHTRRLGEETVAAVVARCRERGWPLPELAVGSPEANELRRRLRAANIVARGKARRVVDNIQAVRALVRDGHGYRALRVHPRCRHLIEEMTRLYRYPPEGRHRPDEKPLDGNDHCCDALGYWVNMRVRPGAFARARYEEAA